MGLKMLVILLIAKSEMKTAVCGSRFRLLLSSFNEVVIHPDFATRAGVFCLVIVN